MAIYDRLERMDGLTQAEREIADYVLAHPDEVSRMNIGDLVRATYSSNATVVRFCRKLGVGGFREFRVELASETERRRNITQGVDVDYPFVPEQTARDVVQGVATLMRQAVETCNASINPSQIEMVARAIHRARCVYLYATGDSLVTAMAFSNMLLKLGILSLTCDTHGERTASAMSARPGDVAIIVSYSGDVLGSYAMEDCLRILRERKVETVLVSSNESDSLWINRTILIPATESQAGKIATYYSQSCIRFVLNCIYGEVYALDYQASKAHKDRIDAINAAQ